MIEVSWAEYLYSETQASFAWHNFPTNQPPRKLEPSVILHYFLWSPLPICGTFSSLMSTFSSFCLQHLLKIKRPPPGNREWGTVPISSRDIDKASGILAFVLFCPSSMLSFNKNLLNVNSVSQTKLVCLHSRLWNYVLMKVQKQYTKLKAKALTEGRMNSVHLFWQMRWSFNCKNT